MPARSPRVLLLGLVAVLCCILAAALGACFPWTGDHEDGTAALRPSENPPISRAQVTISLVEQGPVTTSAAISPSKETDSSPSPTERAPADGSPTGTLIQSEDLVYLGGAELKADDASARTQALPAAVLVHELSGWLDRQWLQMHNMVML